MFDRGQHVGLRTVQQVDGEQVQGQDRLGLGAQELRPIRAGTSGRGVDAMPLQDLPDRRGCDGHAEPGKITGDPPVPPMLVVGRHAQPGGRCGGGSVVALAASVWIRRPSGGGRRPGCLTASRQHPDDLPVRAFRQPQVTGEVRFGGRRRSCRTAGEIIRCCRERLAHAKWPRTVEFAKAPAAARWQALLEAAARKVILTGTWRRRTLQPGWRAGRCRG